MGVWCAAAGASRRGFVAHHRGPVRALCAAPPRPTVRLALRPCLPWPSWPWCVVVWCHGCVGCAASGGVAVLHTARRGCDVIVGSAGVGSLRHCRVPAAVCRFLAVRPVPVGVRGRSVRGAGSRPCRATAPGGSREVLAGGVVTVHRACCATAPPWCRRGCQRAPSGAVVR